MSDFGEKAREGIQSIKQLPIWLQYAVAFSSIFGVLGTIFGGWGIYIALNANKLETKSIGETSVQATSTIAISDLLSKALKFDTQIEQEDFLKKYIDAPVQGRGVVKNVKRAGTNFLVDLNVKAGIQDVLLTCTVNNDEASEKEILLLKGKTVSFVGTYTNSNYWGGGLGMGECKLSW